MESGTTTLPLREEQLAALAKLVRDGTYRRTAAKVADDDPDLANR
jgi:hypothetical protein